MTVWSWLRFTITLWLLRKADAETPTVRQGRHYVLRSRVRHNACQRRMCGTVRQSSSGATNTYHKCPHDPTHPGQAAAYPDHGNVMLREDTLMAAIAGFFDQYVFGHDRAGRLAAQLPPPPPSTPKPAPGKRHTCAASWPASTPPSTA